jgi:integrase
MSGAFAYRLPCQWCQASKVAQLAHRDGSANAVSLPGVTPNDLRHTAASLAVSAGGNVLTLARMLGHEDPSLTLKAYADLFDTDLDALADVLDQHRATALRPSVADGDRR